MQTLSDWKDKIQTEINKLNNDNNHYAALFYMDRNKHFNFTTNLFNTEEELNTYLKRWDGGSAYNRHNYTQYALYIDGTLIEQLL